MPKEHPTRIGKYDIEEFLGGGMSHVYRARDSVLGRPVALKLLTDAGVADDESRARFLVEARTASNINHENVISIYDFGEDAGRPYIVMELLEGRSLREVIKSGPLPGMDQRLRISLQVARALDHIHAKKIVHRDIKPENIHIDAEGKVTLMDFGIAKIQGMNLTRTGFTLGTPYYMAPEQVMGQPLTAATDVYAFGILMFELFSGRKPIDGGSVELIFQKILNEPIDVAPLQSRTIPAGVVDLVWRCTQKQPAQRPASFALVVQELDRILGGGGALPPAQQTPTQQHSGSPVAAGPPMPPPQNEPSPADASKPPGLLQNQFVLMVLGAVLAAAFVFGVYECLILAHVL